MKIEMTNTSFVAKVDCEKVEDGYRTRCGYCFAIITNTVEGSNLDYAVVKKMVEAEIKKWGNWSKITITLEGQFGGTAYIIEL